MRLPEGPLGLAGCVEKPSGGGRSAKWITRSIREEVSRRISKTLEFITPAEMVKKQQSEDMVDRTDHGTVRPGLPERIH